LRTVVDGADPKIVTVATGNAFSAAADILAQGDHVMAFRHARLLFHGNRVAHSAITRKTTEDIENELEASDTKAAQRVPLHVFRRLLRHYIQHVEQVRHFQAPPGTTLGTQEEPLVKNAIDVPALVRLLCEKVGGNAAVLLARPRLSRCAGSARSLLYTGVCEQEDRLRDLRIGGTAR
jgi:hypothetical protein